MTTLTQRVTCSNRLHACVSMTAALALLATSLALPRAMAADMDPVIGTGWRTDGTGLYPRANPVTEWGPKVNVIWSTATPTWSNATPCVVGNQIFICSEQATLLCVSLRDGAILWQQSCDAGTGLSADERKQREAAIAQIKEFNAKIEADSAPVREERRKLMIQLRQLGDAGDPAEKTKVQARVKELGNQINDFESSKKPFPAEWGANLPPTHPTNGYSSPTPVSDGKVVFAQFGTGMAGCFDLDGKPLWTRAVDAAVAGWGHSASPVLVGDKVIIHVKDVVALDLQTGKEVWRAPSQQHWGSPVVTRIDGVEVIITTAGQAIRASDGKVLASGMASMEYNAPVVVGGVAYFIQGNAAATAWRLPEKVDDSFKPQQLWTQAVNAGRGDDRNYASPIVHNGLAYSLQKDSILTVQDAATGKIVYSQPLKLGGTAYPSLVLAGKYLLASSDSGTTAVIQTGREFNEIARNKLAEFRSTPVFVGDRMLVRCGSKLYCIGRPDAVAMR